MVGETHALRAVAHAAGRDADGRARLPVCVPLPADQPPCGLDAGGDGIGQGAIVKVDPLRNISLLLGASACNCTLQDMCGCHLPTERCQRRGTSFNTPLDLPNAVAELPICRSLNIAHAKH